MDNALRRVILTILEGANDMSIATIRRDGYPQVTTVSYANDGLRLYFGCAGVSQKAGNIALNGKVSLTINLPYSAWSEIRGLSLGGRAALLTDPQEIAHAADLLKRKFPKAISEYASDGFEGIVFCQVTPEVMSVLDYRKGFGHTDLLRDLGDLQLAPDPVEEADLESFPASDAPAWTRTTVR